MALACGSIASAQERQIAITGDRLSGVVLPIEPVTGAITISAARGWSWAVDDTRRLLLEGDVAITIGRHNFVAQEAVVWLNRLPSADGLINQIAIYFPAVDDPTKRAGLGVTGRQLLVTGSARGDVSLTTVVLEEQEPPSSTLLREAEKRLAAHITSLQNDSVTLMSAPQADTPRQVPDPELVPGGDPLPPAEIFPPAGPATLELPPTQAGPIPLFSPDGRIAFNAQELVIEEKDDTVIAQGDIVIEYAGLDPQGQPMRLTLTAHRGVIFLQPGVLASMRDRAADLKATEVQGIYLEGSVIATDGNYTLRAERIYYDVIHQQAAVVDAILRTYSRTANRAFYARAQEMRQVAADQWTAKKARISTSEFFTPHLAVGAQSVTVTSNPEVNDQIHVDSRGNTLRANGTPFFYWPRFAGTLSDVPLRSIETGYRDNDGARLETTWDFFGLTGIEKPSGVDMALKIDGYTERGAGLGTEFAYQTGPHSGLLDLYGLYDEGIDKTASGLNVDPEDEFRGLALAEHTSRLGRYWTLQAQGSYISDDTFITAWRREDFSERREYESSIYLKRQKGNSALDALLKYDFNDAIHNDSILASRSYLVDKVPELTYRRYGDSLFDDNFTYSSEYRATRMRLVLPDGTPESLGVPGAAFGLAADDDISAALRAEGYRTAFVSRADTRHELAMPKTLGILEVTPFVTGRFTGYMDDEFEAYSSDSDEMRMFGAAGVRAKTSFQRIANGVESRVFDLHRLRHLLEPHMTAWYGYSNVAGDDLPVYDAEVEGVDGTEAVKLGVRNVLQTQRGGPGRWRSVDFLSIDTGIVFNGSDANQKYPTPQFFDYRPEYSVFGDHVYGTGTWLFSDTLSFAGSGTWDLEADDLARGSVGTEIIHSPIFSSYIEYRVLTASDNELLDIGWDYRVTRKYRLSLVPSYDLRADEFRAVSVSVRRRLPDVDFIVRIEYDQILDETSFSASLGRTAF